jgi:hypothetical protein
MSNRIILASLAIFAALAFSSTPSKAGPLDDYRQHLMQQCNQNSETRRDRRQCRREVRRTIRQMRNALRAEYRQCRRERPRIPRQECRDRRLDQLAQMVGAGQEADL